MKERIIEIINHLQSEETRWDAILELKLVSDPSAIKLLIPFLKNENWVIRWCVTEKLADFKKPELAYYIVPLLVDPEEYVRKNAKKALLRLGVSGCAHVLDSIFVKNSELRREIILYLKQFDDSILPLLQSKVTKVDLLYDHILLHIIWLLNFKNGPVFFKKLLHEKYHLKVILVLLLSGDMPLKLTELLPLSKEKGLKKIVFSFLDKKPLDKVIQGLISVYQDPQFKSLSIEAIRYFGLKGITVLMELSKSKKELVPVLKEIVAQSVVDSNKQQVIQILSKDKFLTQTFGSLVVSKKGGDWFKLF